ncbi:MAG: ferrous iron transporter B [Acidobacteriota bacterium]
MAECHDSSTATLPPLSGAEGRSHVVAIIGPPNAGKSTLFNRLTGLHQKVANFPGVTVEHHMGKVKLEGGREVFAIDLPGVYSLLPRTEDERVTHDVLMGTMKGLPRPDAVLLVLDSTNLSRHLMLAAPVLAVGLPTLVILNMADDLEKRGGGLDVAALSAQLGAPVALVSAYRGDGFEKVHQFLAGATNTPERVAARMQLPVLQDIPHCRQWAADVGAGGKYRAPAPPIWTRRLDDVFLHPVLGPLIFVVVVIAVFQLIFTWATPLMDGVAAMIEASGHWVGGMLPEGLWKSLLIDGVWSGVGSVLVFLPQILLLFLVIGILEDSGYLARAAVIADRTMARVGLQGKSFIPLLSAYACAVPAIMATRTIENKRDRIATILIAPFMTCSARIAPYTLIIAAFIPNNRIIGGFLGARAAAFLGLYALGFLAAVLTARVLKSTVLKSGKTPFILEMPPYRWPTLQSLGLRLLDRAKVFLHRAGTVILSVAVILWILASLPLENGKQPPIADSFVGQIGHLVEPVIRPLGFNWKIGIGLITSLAAREVIVGTLGTIYGIEGNEENAGLQNNLGLQKALHQDLTPGGAVALLIFFAFAMQCFSTIAVVRRETGGWRWPIIQFSYMTGMAYVCALIANQAITRWY